MWRDDDSPHSAEPDRKWRREVPREGTECAVAHAREELGNSPPHFHAKYGEYEITVEIGSGIVEGKFPRRSLGHVMEWYQASR